MKRNSIDSYEYSFDAGSKKKKRKKSNSRDASNFDLEMLPTTFQPL